MDDTSKYLIHAAITADGVVERSDVVGAIFGQTEGLLGEELDLRDLQQSSKVGRIDVEITSEGGQSFGEVTVASSLDRVETAILAASLETITRVGPCRARVEVTGVEDVREAKRREVARRAKELLTEAFDEGLMSGDDIVDEVRESVRVADVSEYEGLPAGPRVADSDAVVVVEGRADVVALLGHGIKNAVAVEGTDVPEAVATLSRDRTVTAFLDGDRGGELVLRELAQVGDVDHVAFAPEGRSVEDLDRRTVVDALQRKVPFDDLDGAESLRAAVAEATGREPPAATNGEDERERPPRTDAPDDPAPADADETDEAGDADETADAGETDETDAATAGDGADPDRPRSLREHVAAVVGGSGRVRLLDADLATVAEDGADAAFAAVRDAESAPYAVVLDGEASQRLLDVAAQRGVEHLVAATTGEFVKRPVDVRVRTADQLAA